MFVLLLKGAKKGLLYEIAFFLRYPGKLYNEAASALVNA